MTDDRQVSPRKLFQGPREELDPHMLMSALNACRSPVDTDLGWNVKKHFISGVAVKIKLSLPSFVVIRGFIRQ